MTIVPALRDPALDAAQRDSRVERLLAGLRWEVECVRRDALREREALILEAGEATLIYTVTGTVEADTTGVRGSAGAATAGAWRRTVPVLQAGDALFAVGRAPVRLRATAETTLMVAHLRGGEGVDRLLETLPDVLSVGGFAELEPGAAALATHMGSPAAGPACPSPRASVVCSLMATTLAITVLRAWAAQDCAPADWPARAADPFLARVLDAIHTDPGREWTVESLAALGAMSRSVFAERFRAAFGRSPASYLAQVRMEIAKALLAGGGASVSEVSRRLGYSSDEGFSRAFRRHTGLTPSAWRAGGATPTAIAG